MKDHGRIILAMDYAKSLLAEFPDHSVGRRMLSEVIDRELQWELLDTNGDVLGRYTYFPNDEAGQDKREPEDVLRIRDRHTGEIAHYIGYGCWTEWEPEKS